MLRVGLTGGIGSGKSTVAAALAGHGALVVDADQIAREVVARGTPGLAALADRFGPGVLTAEGDLDRAALAALAFSDDSARRDLEAITHPRIAARAAELFATARPDRWSSTTSRCSSRRGWGRHTISFLSLTPRSRSGSLASWGVV